jgi:ABC-type glycerol-3-phosphate transport system substrate-binding protein
LIPPAALLLSLAGLGTAIALVLQPEQRDPELVLWTASAEMAERFESAGPPPGPTAGVELMSSRSLDLRLMTLLQAAPSSTVLPDVVHLEILSAAKFLEAGPGHVGLLPLEGRLAASGLVERVLPGTLEAWSRDGHVYGVPIELHTVTLTYRKDLFAAAGLDPSVARTWDELAGMLRQYCDYWQGRGRPNRRGLELARTTSEHITLMLQQRGVSLVDSAGRPRLDDARIPPLLAFYSELLAGERPVAISTSEGHGRWVADLRRGDVAMIWTPGWKLPHLEAAVPELSGKLAMMELPRFVPGDARTAVWGGAMLGIPSGASNPDASWNLLVHAAFSGDGKIPAAPVLSASVRGLFGDAPITDLYRELGKEVRPGPMTPLGTAAAAHLAAAVSRAADAREAGVSGKELDELISAWLAASQLDLERRAAFAAGGRP